MIRSFKEETTQTFKDKYGEELFNQIFENIYGDSEDEHITVEREMDGGNNSRGWVDIGMNGGVLHVEFEDGDSNGSEIIEFEFTKEVSK